MVDLNLLFSGTFHTKIARGYREVAHVRSDSIIRTGKLLGVNIQTVELVLLI